MSFHPETPQTLNSKAPTNPCKCKSMYLKVANEKGKSLWFVYFKNAVLLYCMFVPEGWYTTLSQLIIRRSCAYSVYSINI